MDTLQETMFDIYSMQITGLERAVLEFPVNASTKPDVHGAVTTSLASIADTLRSEIRRSNIDKVSIDKLIERINNIKVKEQ